MVIENNQILEIIDQDTTVLSAFWQADEILRQAVQGISDLVVKPGIVNVDFADVKAIMQDAGSALMGIGKATGEERAIEAARSAVNSPLLELSIDGARGVLFSVSGGEDLTMYEINEAAKVITDSIHPDAKVIFGAVMDDQLSKGELRVTVIATGFSEMEPSSVHSVSDDDEDKEGTFAGKNEGTENSSKTIANAQLKDKDNDKGKEDDDEDWDIPAFIRKKMK